MSRKVASSVFGQSQTGVKIEPCVIYDMSLKEWLGPDFYYKQQESSSVVWSDIDCGRGANLYGLWLYSDSSIANTVYIEVQSWLLGLANGSPDGKFSSFTPVFKHGRCVLINTQADSVYVEVINKYCV
jgi:hypothetical protein